MATIDDVLRWKPEQLKTLGDTLIKRRKTLTDLQDEVDESDPPASWYGTASEGAGRVHEKLRLRLLDITAEVGKVAASVDFAETEIKTAKTDLESAISGARAQGFEVNTKTGVVTDPGTYDNEMESSRATRRLNAAAGKIDDALKKANDADADLAKALQAANDGKIDGGTGTLNDAAAQLPSGLEGMSPKEIAKRYANDAALTTVQFWLEAEAELATWEVEGAAKATYEVKADGTVVMKLRLEAGLGREIDAGGAEVDVSGGGTTELELTFDSKEKADAFLRGLDDAALDFEWRDIGNPPAAVVTNVAEYVGKQNITSFTTGIYGKAEAEFDAPWAKGEGSARVDGYYDWVKDEYGVKFTGKVDAEIGGKDSGYNGSAELAAEAKLDSSGNLKETTFTGKLSGTVANEKLGIDLPNTSTGAGVDVELKMDENNPYWNDFEKATTSGDFDRAASLAMDHGRVVARVTSIEDYGSKEYDVDVGVGGGEVKYGGNAESADQIWVRPAGEDFVLPLKGSDLR